jgi:hypothetical protein
MSKSFTEKIAADKNLFPVSLPGFGVSVDFGDRAFAAWQRRPVNRPLRVLSIRVNSFLQFCCGFFGSCGKNGENPLVGGGDGRLSSTNPC